jgi:nucleoside-diphosphate-sugar epimerase
MIDNFYQNKKVLVTGGLGFIGSTLSRQLVDLGAKVTIVDSLLPDTGGNMFNIAGCEEKLTVNISDVRDQYSTNVLVRNQDLIFNLAGVLSHIDSMENPFNDLEINCTSQLSLLESCLKFNPDAKVIYAGTRNQYGKAKYLPVDENHPMEPIDVNGINCIAAEWYHTLYYRVHGLKTCSLRLSNTYGPRHQMKHSRQGVLNWFVRQIMDGEDVKLYGGGKQVRDCLYVDDVVKAFLMLGASDRVWGEAYNLGAHPASLEEFVGAAIEAWGGGTFKEVAFPKARKAIEVGDFIADWTKINQAVGWKPKYNLKTGLAKTFKYYQKYRQHYW